MQIINEKRKAFGESMLISMAPDRGQQQGRGGGIRGSAQIFLHRYWGEEDITADI
jgi:hypothetical protein